MELLFMLLYFVIIGLVIEFSVSILNMTGLDSKISRFQVISMLTGTGFTTEESNSIIDHPVRRKIGAFLILFGAFSLAVIISSISNMLANNLRILELTFAIFVLIVLVILSRIPRVKKYFKDKLHTEMEEHYDIWEHPMKEVLFLDEDDIVSEVIITEDSDLVGKKTREIVTREEDINLLFVKRGKIKIRKEIGKETLHEGDQLFLYGNKKEIEVKFKRELKHMKKG
ncbi:TrkA C-terminal domain-containing protein [Peribacillus alkalitolerans]|uniref:TrkA C-terminal domain-containing protein n=1 Tax=Peribacillus alkalitolerans TaxID=1550385 RepID=UPI0013D248F4|nr:TrkA C-terminal domain-containing protein [Peribacillus alkalitolerans]